MVQGKTIAELVVVLQAGGIEVSDHHEGGGARYGAMPVIVFRGDDGAGFRALELAWEHDYEPQGLIRDWTIWDRDVCEPDWTLVFEDEMGSVPD